MAQQSSDRGRSQVRTGKVVSDRMDKTVVVEVVNTVMDRLYRRFVKKTAKFYAHDAGNECRVGDRVRIVSSRPLSAKKRWRVQEIVERAEGI